MFGEETQNAIPIGEDGELGQLAADLLSGGPAAEKRQQSRAEAKAAKQEARAQELRDCTAEVQATLEKFDAQFSVILQTTYRDGQAITTPLVQIVGN